MRISDWSSDVCSSDLLILAGIGLSPFVTMDVAMVALAGYLLLSIHAFLSARVLGELKLSYLSAGPTELRFMLIGMTVMMMVLGTAPGLFGRWSGFDIFVRSEENTSELQSLMRISYDVFCLKDTKHNQE